MIIARAPEGLREPVDAAGRLAGVSLVYRLDIGVPVTGREHFGFRDGISGPYLVGSADQPLPGQDAVQPGEFVFGYPDESGTPPKGPAPDVLGRNGCYLAFRQLHTDVAGFRRYVRDNARSPEDDGVERGIIFVFMGASLSRQFEFVQQVWLNDGDFAGLGTERDPLVGDSDGSGVHVIPATPVRRRLTGLPRFVTVRGGEYCFLPGPTALEWLATLPDPAGEPSTTQPSTQPTSQPSSRPEDAPWRHPG
ncbi:hypothetical protein [Streptomyces sp. NPDC001678]|uniref:hypothetical protein n=1 Tax=Streptomyces sp. NPDC001678 TaxID=3364599 RepID=UPI00367B3E9A